MFSNSSKYALRAVLYLALYSNANKKLVVKDFYKEIEVPKAYLSKLLQELARHQLISSTRGPKGGFYLSKENLSCSLWDIISTIDNKKKLRSCLLKIEKCDELHPCAIHHLIAPSRSELIKSLERKTIEKMMLDMRQQGNNLKV